MRAAFMRVDVVGKRVDRLGVAVVPLQGDLDVDAVLLAVHVNRFVVDDGLVLIEEADKRGYPTLVEKLVALPAIALVIDGDRHAAVEERELAQPLREGVEAELHGLENLRVRLEGDLRAALLRRARDLEAADRIAALVGLLVDLRVAPDLEVQRLRQRVDDGDADTVETAGDFVAVVVELAAGVEHGHHDFGRGSAARVLIDGDASAVVDDGHGVVDVQRDVDLVAEAGERLVYRVVDDFVDEVVQARSTGRADVHRRALADSLQSFEDFDFVRAVVGRAGTADPVVAVVAAVRAGRGCRSAANSLLRPGGCWLLIGFLWFEFRHVSDGSQTRIGMIT